MPMVPAMMKTPIGEMSVPENLVVKPPPVAVNWVQSTLHCQCGQALATTLMRSQAAGAIRRISDK